MDWSLFHDINSLARHTGWAHGAMRSYAKYGIALFALALLVGALIGLRRWSPRSLARTMWTGAASLLALALNQPIADAVDRARPYASHPNVLVLISRSADPSFMSDHSVAAGAIAVGLCFVSWRLGLVTIVIAAVMAFARVYVGAHYVGDVVAGLMFGGAIAAAGVPIVDRLLAPVFARLLATPLGERLADSIAPHARNV